MAFTRMASTDNCFDLQSVARQVEAVASSTSGLGALVCEALTVIDEVLDAHGYDHRRRIHDSLNFGA